MQLSRLYNKRVQNEAGGAPESSRKRVEPPTTADEGGLPGSIIVYRSAWRLRRRQATAGRAKAQTPTFLLIQPYIRYRKPP